MKQNESIGLTALIEQKRQSVEKTRAKLEAALSHLTSESSSHIRRNKLSATSVAKTAGVDRVTLYRFHKPILAKIKEINTSSDHQPNQHNVKPIAPTTIQEYRAAAEEAQREVTALARINYRLDARISELEAAIGIRDERIKELQRQLNTKSAVGKAK